MKRLFKSMLLTCILFVTNITAESNTTDVENFVSRFYTEVLGRTADPVGLADWTQGLTSGKNTGSDVAKGFIFSDEFIARDTNNANFINILYRAFFNRDADTDGFNGWLSVLIQGKLRKDVLDGFLFSQEFANLAEEYGINAVAGTSADEGIEEFVKRFYLVVLGRTAEPEGLSNWVNKLKTKTATGADIAMGFVFSDEFDEKSKDDARFLNTLYEAFFNRDADLDGFNNWLSQLEQGVSRKDVLFGFLQSSEFVTLAESYGVLAFDSGALEVIDYFGCMENSLKDFELDFNPFSATIDDETKVIEAYDKWAFAREGRSWYFETPYKCYETNLNGPGIIHVCTYGTRYQDLNCGQGSSGTGFLF